MKAANKALSAKDGLQYAAANRELHECLEAPAPAAVRQLITETWDRLWQERRRMSLFRLVPARRQLAQREHTEIFKAVRARDPDAAAEAMLRHRESTIAAWRQALKGLA
jgi:DNA-binding GntR family transcriptional regulator